MLAAATAGSRTVGEGPTKKGSRGRFSRWWLGGVRLLKYVGGVGCRPLDAHQRIVRAKNKGIVQRGNGGGRVAGQHTFVQNELERQAVVGAPAARPRLGAGGRRGQHGIAAHFVPATLVEADLTGSVADQRCGAGDDVVVQRRECVLRGDHGLQPGLEERGRGGERLRVDDDATVRLEQRQRLLEPVHVALVEVREQFLHEGLCGLGVAGAGGVHVAWGGGGGAVAAVRQIRARRRVRARPVTARPGNCAPG